MPRVAPRNLAILAVGVAAAVVIAGVWVVEWTGSNRPSVTVQGPLSPTNYSVVHYASSVDGFALSYSEWLPGGFTPDHSYPLIVYLHGQQDTSGRWFPSGLSSDLLQSLTTPMNAADTQTAQALINATRAHGAILIAPNTRSGSGWYINSPCGGPQEQDILDAIAAEKSLRPVGSVYLMGHSMGTEGTLYLAAQNPGLFSGIALVAPVTDLFEDVAYRLTLVSNPQDPWANVSIQAKAYLFCGVLPGTENSSAQAVAQVFEDMSPLRFDPGTFAHVPIYLTAGGQDDRAPNNLTYWAAWMNANNSFVNATCNYVPSLGEPQPPGCAQQTLGSLHLQSPGLYSFRYVYEPTASHTIAQLCPEDLMGFWFGTLPGGYYLGAASSCSIESAPGLSY